MAAIIVTIIQILLEIIHNDNVLSSIYSNVKSSWKDRQEKSGTMIRIWKHHSWSINLGSNGIFWGVLAWKHKKSQRKKKSGKLSSQLEELRFKFTDMKKNHLA